MAFAVAEVHRGAGVAVIAGGHRTGIGIRTTACFNAGIDGARLAIVAVQGCASADTAAANVACGARRIVVARTAVVGGHAPFDRVAHVVRARVLVVATKHCAYTNTGRADITLAADIAVTASAAVWLGLGGALTAGWAATGDQAIGRRKANHGGAARALAAVAEIDRGAWVAVVASGPRGWSVDATAGRLATIYGARVIVVTCVRAAGAAARRANVKHRARILVIANGTAPVTALAQAIGCVTSVVRTRVCVIAHCRFAGQADRTLARIAQGAWVAVVTRGSGTVDVLATIQFITGIRAARTAVVAGNDATALADAALAQLALGARVAVVAGAILSYEGTTLLSATGIGGAGVQVIARFFVRRAVAVVVGPVADFLARRRCIAQRKAVNTANS